MEWFAEQLLNFGSDIFGGTLAIVAGVYLVLKNFFIVAACVIMLVVGLKLLIGNMNEGAGIHCQKSSPISKFLRSIIGVMLIFAFCFLAYCGEQAGVLQMMILHFVIVAMILCAMFMALISG